MKRFVCALLCAVTLFCAACAETAVEGVAFHEGWDVRDANIVFYEIFVGSFSDSDGDGIGDLRGIINRMDYLNDGDPQSGLSLGVEGLWLTPIFLSSTSAACGSSWTCRSTTPPARAAGSRTSPTRT